MCEGMLKAFAEGNRGTCQYLHLWANRDANKGERQIGERGEIKWVVKGVQEFLSVRVMVDGE